MKKFIISIAIAGVFISTTAFSRPREGDNPALTTFQNDFKGAQNVQWTEGKEVIYASFVLGGTRAIAFFNMSGQLLGTARNLVFDQLPLSVITGINKRFPNSSVFDITEYTADTDVYYKMSASVGNRQIKIRATADGEIFVEGKSKIGK